MDLGLHGLEPDQRIELGERALDGRRIGVAAEPRRQLCISQLEIRPEDRDFWSFRPPVPPAVPTPSAIGRVRTPIDAFLLARLEAKGLSFSPDASPQTLDAMASGLEGRSPSPLVVAALVLGSPDFERR